MNDELTLCVTVRFLTGTYHGRDRDGEPEWPPSPLRLFQALVAAAGARRTVDEQAAMKWLEERSAPDVCAHEAKATGQPRKHYVPNNDVDRQSDHAASRVEKVFRPLHLPDRAEVQYRWPVDQADRPHAKVVTRLAGRLRCLGWGIDAVAGRGGINCGEPDGATRWVAGTSGKVRRVPRCGTLDSLDDAHDDAVNRFDEGQYRPSDANVATRTVAYRPAGGLPVRPWLAFSLVHIEDGSRASIWPAKVAEVAGQVRHATKRAAELAGWDDETIRTYVCGHDVTDGRRLSFLPLPSVGHKHVDGMIRRVLIVAPPGDEALLRELRSRLIGPLQPRDGDPTTAMVPCPPDDKVVARYTGCGRTWVSATPAILPGNVSRGSGIRPMTIELSQDGSPAEGGTSIDRKTAKVVRDMLVHAGLAPALVARVALDAVAHLSNLPNAGRFTMKAQPKGTDSKPRKLPRSHVVITFRQVVAGPLALGAGKFRGFGSLVATSP